MKPSAVSTSTSSLIRTSTTRPAASTIRWPSLTCSNISQTFFWRVTGFHCFIITNIFAWILFPYITLCTKSFVCLFHFAALLRSPHPVCPPRPPAPVTPPMAVQHQPLCRPSLISEGLCQDPEEVQGGTPPPTPHQQRHHHHPPLLSSCHHYLSYPQLVMMHSKVEITQMKHFLI